MDEAAAWLRDGKLESRHVGGNWHKCTLIEIYQSESYSLERYRHAPAPVRPRDGFVRNSRGGDCYGNIIYPSVKTAMETGLASDTTFTHFREVVALPELTEEEWNQVAMAGRDALYGTIQGKCQWDSLGHERQAEWIRHAKGVVQALKAMGRMQ